MRLQTHATRTLLLGLTLGAVAVAAMAACGARPATSSGPAIIPAAEKPLLASQLPEAAPTARYLAGDAHTHTWLSPDGAHTEAEVAEKAFTQFGLDWIAATDHGGISIHTATGRSISPATWMWRTIPSAAYPAVLAQRARYPDKRILQGVEWHMPGHDHAGVGLEATRLPGSPSSTTVSTRPTRAPPSRAGASATRRGPMPSTRPNGSALTTPIPVT